MPLTKIQSLGITDGTIVNADINASAAITLAKLTGVNDAKAWVNFNGTGTVAIRGSFNVSSITDNGTGDYTINFTTAFADANYCIAGMTRNPDTNGNRGAGGVQIIDNLDPTTSSLRIFTAYGATDVSVGARNDQPVICVSFFR